MELNDLRSLLTVLAFATFVGIVIWAYSGGRKKAFEEAAHLPFGEDDLPVSRRKEEQGISS